MAKGHDIQYRIKLFSIVKPENIIIDRCPKCDIILESGVCGLCSVTGGEDE